MTALEALNLAAPIADAYMSVEERLLVRIARQLSLNDDHQLNEVSKWQLKQLARHGILRQDAHKIIAAGTKGIPGDVAETVRQAIDDTLAEGGIQSMWHNQQFAESAANAVRHYRNQAKDVYNQVNTVMKYKAESTFVGAVNSVAEKWQVLRNTELAGTSQGGYFAQNRDMRREQAEIADKQDMLNILNSNTAAVVSGAESRTKAVRTTIHEMAQKGIPAFVDKSGREWSPEAYVNMDIRATVKNTALEAQFSTMDSLGQDVFEVSSHPGSRPKCRPWQGKLISRSGRTTEITDINGRKHKVIPLSQTSFGEPDGLFGINCGHRPRGVSDGLFRKSSVEYDDTEDKELYNKVCKQRELERRVRKSKTEADMLEAAGDTEGAKEVRRKMAEQNKALKSYCDGNGLKYRSDRVKTYGAIAPKKALDKSGESGIIKARQLAQKKTFNYRDFDEVVDEKSVSELKQYAAEKMGISHISGIDKLKNGRQAHELLSKVEELSEKHGKRFAQISLLDYGDAKTAAETVGNELRLNVQYLNRPEAFQAVLDEWNESGRIPKGCNNVAYVAKHEYSHLLTQDIIDEPHSKIVSAVRRAVKDGCETVSENGNYDCHEFVADLLSAKTLTKSQQKLKDTIMKILK